jgi:hypothetical protein
LQISGTTSGATLFNIIGTQGQLFSVNDSLVGDIFSVNDISGIPILTVNSNDRVTVDGTIVLNSTLSTGLGVATHVVATADISLGNAAYFDYYVMSGTTLRSGTIISVWNSTSAQYTEVSTRDLGGSTSDVSFAVDVSGSNARLRATIASGTWTIKTGIRII